MNLEPLFEAIVKDFARFDRTEERVNLPTVSQLRRVGNTLKSSRNWADYGLGFRPEGR